MDNHAPPEPSARARLTHDQAQELVLRIVSTQAESLLRTAYRNSLCDDDAHDAYQRSMEIFLRRARTLDPRSAHKWIHVVVKREAQELRRVRSGSVPYEAVDFDLHVASEVSTPEERALAKDRARRAAEALRRLKPQERRAMGLKAFGHSYAEIAEATGFSATKVNRALTEGRKSFLKRFETIEAGAECERWRPVLSAMVSGEAAAAQITEARPHLRNCPACRATLRDLHTSRRPLRLVLPVGLVGSGAKVSALLERLLPGLSGGDAAGTAVAGAAAGGGASFLGVSAAKLAGLLAAGAAATGGGLVVAQEARRDGHRPPSSHIAARAAPARIAPVTLTSGVVGARARATTPPKVKARRAARTSGAGARHSATRRTEFAPRGDEPATQASARAAAPWAVKAAAPEPVAPPVDTARGEFAPQP
jgi:RNA polymerase sigma factor (sigma-70 family)